MICAANALWLRSLSHDAEGNDWGQMIAVVVVVVAAPRTGCGKFEGDLSNEAGNVASPPQNRASASFDRCEAWIAVSQDACPFLEYVGLLLDYDRGC